MDLHNNGGSVYSLNFRSGSCFPSLPSHLLLILLLCSSISWGCVIRNNVQNLSASLMGLWPGRRGLDCSNMIIKKTILKIYLKSCGQGLRKLIWEGAAPCCETIGEPSRTLNAEVPVEGTGAEKGGLVVGPMALHRGASDWLGSKGAKEVNTPASFSSNLWSAVRIYFWMNPLWIQRIK